ncbi:hypothetical protein ACFQ51_06010 [Streptomyces kaempferi]
MAGALLLTLCFVSLADAASDSDEMVDGAKRVLCAAHRAPAGTTAATTDHRRQRQDLCCGYRDSAEIRGHRV